MLRRRACVPGDGSCWLAADAGWGAAPFCGPVLAGPVILGLEIWGLLLVWRLLCACTHAHMHLQRCIRIFARTHTRLHTCQPTQVLSTSGCSTHAQCADHCTALPREAQYTCVQKHTFHCVGVCIGPAGQQCCDAGAGSSPGGACQPVGDKGNHHRLGSVVSQ